MAAETILKARSERHDRGAIHVVIPWLCDVPRKTNAVAQLASLL